MHEPTAPQTAGPFFHPCLLHESRDVLWTEAIDGERIRIEGVVFDGIGDPVDDALLEIWQADAHGRYRHSWDAAGIRRNDGFTGFGRTGTDPAGGYWFETIKPGPVPWEGAREQAPHVTLLVFARGLLDRLATRIYFGDEAGNEADPLLTRIPEGRRSTLVAQRLAHVAHLVYRFDIVLQGPNETVFFDI